MSVELVDLAQLVPPALSSVLSLILLFYAWKIDRRLLRVEIELAAMKETIEDVRIPAFVQPVRARGRG